jgi:23S rRNA (pseudouridine1915-N3)-methyltransferase
MKISLIQIGKTQDKSLIAFIKDYEKRLSRFIEFETITLKEAKLHKNAPKDEYKKKEASEIIQHLKNIPCTILLDETGKEYDSISFANQTNKLLEQNGHIGFLIGGAYGFHQSIYNLGLQKIALSKMTFTHQWSRLILVEQLYRAFTIKMNIPYHH